MKNKSLNKISNRLTIILLAILVSIFTMAPDAVQAQHGRHGPGPSHMHGHSHHHHVIGKFITVMAVTAVVVTVVNNNNQKQQYQYNNGTYYQESTQNGQTGYVEVAAPIGAKVPTLPDDNTPITVGSATYYYYASTFYTPDGKDYVVVQPPVGAIVPYAPDGSEKKTVSGIEYSVYAGIYYQAKSDNGNVVYEVVEHP